MFIFSPDPLSLVMGPATATASMFGLPLVVPVPFLSKNGPAFLSYRLVQEPTASLPCYRVQRSFVEPLSGFGEVVNVLNNIS